MKIGLLFPGYGSQSVGMGKELYDNSRVVQEYFEEAYTCINNNLIKLCFASSENELAQLQNAYHAIFVLNASLFELLKEHGVQPAVVAGYGIGQYTALYAAGAFSFPDGLYLLGKHASFLQQVADERKVSMLLVKGIDAATLEKLCKKESTKKEHVHISVVHGADSFMVAGDIAAVERLVDLLDALENVKTVRVPYEFGMFAVHMDAVAEQIKLYLGKVDIKELTCSVVRGTDGSLITQAQDAADLLVGQVLAPFRFDAVIEGFADCDLIIDVGSQQVAQMLRERYPDKQVVSCTTAAELEAIKQVITPPQIVEESAPQE